MFRALASWCINSNPIFFFKMTGKEMRVRTLHLFTSRITCLQEIANFSIFLKSRVNEESAWPKLPQELLEFTVENIIKTCPLTAHAQEFMCRCNFYQIKENKNFFFFQSRVEFVAEFKLNLKKKKYMKRESIKRFVDFWVVILLVIFCFVHYWSKTVAKQSVNTDFQRVHMQQ